MQAKEIVVREYLLIFANDKFSWKFCEYLFLRMVSFLKILRNMKSILIWNLFWLKWFCVHNHMQIRRKHSNHNFVGCVQLYVKNFKIFFWRIKENMANKNEAFNVAVRGFHVYKIIWKPKDGEKRMCYHKNGNSYDSGAVVYWLSLLHNFTQQSLNSGSGRVQILVAVC